ncbi:MAG: MgtC/SapB family protein [Roseateles sp.]|uniref:MgtC/SapB family protein n=1 Tax=Roseateles sp. TaxID=1971397 RepID=UPI004036F754
MTPELAGGFFAALLIGILVGIEREKKRPAGPADTIGGIRTHALLALAGATSAWLGQALQLPWLLVVVIAAVAAMTVTRHVLWRHDGRDAAPSMTSQIAAVLVVLLGGLAATGHQALAVALAVTLSAVLAFKQPLHALVQRLGLDDILAGLKLLIASVIVLPLLPNETMDPWQALNPYQLWLMVVLILALSLAGYVGMRWLGPARGAAITGLAGGLVSSTATTLNFARDSRRAGPAANSSAITAGILCAWLVMFLRVMTIVAVLNPPLLAALWLPLVVMSVVSGALALRHYLAGAAAASTATASTAPLKNPFSLGAAIRFGALFAVVLVIVKLAQQQFPAGGLIAVSALAGAADVDAIVLSLSGRSAGAMRTVSTAWTAWAVLAALLANTVVKIAMVMLTARGDVRRSMGLASVAICSIGAAAAWAWL